MRKYKASQNKVSSVWGASKADNTDVSGLWEGERNSHTHLCFHTSNSQQILQPAELQTIFFSHISKILHIYMFGIKSTENRSWVICHPFPANLLVNFIVFETHFQAKTPDELDPTCSFLVPSLENFCVPSSCWHCLHKPLVLGVPGSSSWIWTQPPALTVPELLLSCCPCNSSHWVLNVPMKRTLSSVWLHAQIPSITSEITFPKP